MSSIFNQNLPDYNNVKEIINEKSFERKVKETLESIEKDIVVARDKGIDQEGKETYFPPVYLTKRRVKSQHSAFLKTKRKMRPDLKFIKDFAGIRILVLFDDDLLKIFQFMLFHVIDPGFLEEVTLFNLPDRLVEEIKMDSSLAQHKKAGFKIDEKFEHFRVINRKSGYQSIHFIFRHTVKQTNNLYKGEKGIYGKVADDDFFIEAQVRTLLQDVWSEMEHKLAYKQGKTNPHISTSFKLLQEDISTMGRRLSNIQTMRNSHLALDHLAIRESRPYSYFSYEKEWEPKCFLAKKLAPDDKALAERYKELTDQYNNGEITPNAFGEQALTMVDDLNKLFKKADKDADQNSEDKIKYWYLMEKGFITFLIKDYDASGKLYDKVLQSSEFDHQPVPLFRRTEMNFVVEEGLDEKDLIPCLVGFDEVIARIKSLHERGKMSDVARQNGAAILAKIAAIYELMGAEEYMDYCISLFEEAGKLLDGVKEKKIRKSKLLVIQNNLGWAYLEKFRTSTDKGDMKFWHEKCVNELKPVYKEVCKAMVKDPEKFSSNMYDTLSWFFYLTYIHLENPNLGNDVISSSMVRPSKGENLLTIAQRFCGYIWRVKNKSSFLVSSISRQRSRAELIMNPNVQLLKEVS
ncbi:MAG: hypothetical protein HQL68_08870 [Magnetococcales bacterium]|nr:hypothetical protein [Magnetococcales bacterium]